MSQEHQRDWPAAPWRLTAPETHVLRWRGGRAEEVFRLAVINLAASGALRLEWAQMRRVLVFKEQRAVLSDGPRVRSAVEPSLAGVLAAYEQAGKRRFRSAAEPGRPQREIEGVLLSQFVAKAEKPGPPWRRRRGSRRYRDRDVLPSLIRRGLVEPAVPSRLRRRLVLSWTPAGQGAAVALDAWIAAGRQRMGDWVVHDPGRTIAYAKDAGAILLLRELTVELGLLADRLAEPGDAGPVLPLDCLDFDGAREVVIGFEELEDPLAPLSGVIAGAGG